MSAVEEEQLAPTRNRRPLVEHRTCAWCGKVKPLNEECFEPKTRRKSGFRGVCRKCRKAKANG